MKISKLLATLEKIQKEHGDVPVYKKERGGQGSAWEFFELKSEEVEVRKNLDDWGKRIDICVVID